MIKLRLYGPTVAPNLETNGIGVLNDAIDAKVTEERNGLYELVLKYPLGGQHFDKIQYRHIIVAKPATNREPQPFRIYRITKPMSGIVTIHARHISYDLLGITVDPFTAGTAAEAMLALESKCLPKNPFRMATDIASTARMESKVPTSVRGILGGTKGSVLDVYGGEFEWDGYTVHLWEARGRNNGVTIRYGKNLIDLKQEENCANVFTGIRPYWSNSEGETVVLPEKVVKAPGGYVFESYKPVNFATSFREAPTEDQLRQRAERYVRDNEIGVPKVSLKVKYLDLSQATGEEDNELLERVNLCDQVTVHFDALGVDATAKVVKTVYNVLLDRMDSVEIGEAKTNIADTIVDSKQEILDQVQSIVGPGLIHSIATSAAASLLGAKGGAVRVLDTDEDGLPDTIYIADDPDPARAVRVWRYNYEGWGASKNGFNGPFTMAATLDQGIIADQITAGTLNANLIKAGILSDLKGKNTINMETGEANIACQNFTVRGKSAEDIAREQAMRVGNVVVNDLNNYKTTVNAALKDLQGQMDGQIMTWFGQEVPITDNYPASGWKTPVQKQEHIGDLYYITQNPDLGSKAYRWVSKRVQGNDVYYWEELVDTEALRALELASKALDTADGKRRTFLEQPKPPYDRGDLWAQGADGTMLVCVTSRAEGTSYIADDWVPPANYIDSVRAESIAKAEAGKQLQAYAETVTSRLDGLQTQVDGHTATYFNPYEPTGMNEPASGWITLEQKREHLDDLFYDTNTGYAYRWASSGGQAYGWERITDQDIVKALDSAKNAVDVADGKRRTFITTPTPPYDKGDLWAQGPAGRLLVCNAARTAEEAFYRGDWEDAANYIDAEQAGQIADNAAGNAADRMTQEQLFNKLTNNGDLQGLYMREGQLYINAAYMVSGVLRSKTGGTNLDLDNGKFTMTAGSLDIGDFTVSDTGRVNARSGTIGGMNFNASSMYNDSLALNADGLTLSEGGKSAARFDGTRWANSDDIGTTIVVQPQGNFLTLTHQDTKDANPLAFLTYTKRPIYNVNGELVYGGYNTLTLGSEIDFANYKAKNFNPEGGVNVSNLQMYIPTHIRSGGTASGWIVVTLEIKNGIITGFDIGL